MMLLRSRALLLSSALQSRMLPDVNVNVLVLPLYPPLLTNTPPPLVAVQPTMLPPSSVKVLLELLSPGSCTYTPPPADAVQPTILPPVMVNSPPRIFTPPPYRLAPPSVPVPPVMTPPVTVCVPFVSSSTQRPSLLGVNLCSASGLLSFSVKSPIYVPVASPSIKNTLPVLPVIFSTRPFRSSVTVRLTVRVVLISISAISLISGTVLFASAAVNSASVVTGVAAGASSAKTAAGSSASSMQPMSRMLSSRFFMVVPRFLSRAPFPVKHAQAEGTCMGL